VLCWACLCRTHTSHGKHICPTGPHLLAVCCTLGGVLGRCLCAQVLVSASCLRCCSSKSVQIWPQLQARTCQICFTSDSICKPEAATGSGLNPRMPKRVPCQHVVPRLEHSACFCAMLATKQVCDAASVSCPFVISALLPTAWVRRASCGNRQPQE
jgi:hypothetical protein